jgi:hypothetical protein
MRHLQLLVEGYKFRVASYELRVEGYGFKVTF